VRTALRPKKWCRRPTCRFAMAARSTCLWLPTHHSWFRAHGHCINRPVGQSCRGDSTHNWMEVGAQIKRNSAIPGDSWNHATPGIVEMFPHLRQSLLEPLKARIIDRGQGKSLSGKRHGSLFASTPSSCHCDAQASSGRHTSLVRACLANWPPGQFVR